MGMREPIDPGQGLPCPAKASGSRKLDTGLSITAMLALKCLAAKIS